MEFINLKGQYLCLKEDIDRAISEVLLQSNFIMGPQVMELEEKLASYVGRKYCITCGNGTDALVLSLLAHGIGEGDVVFLPTFTYFATGEAVSRVGAKPVFVDSDLETYNIDTDDMALAIEEVVRKGENTPKAVIAVDLFGLPANYPEICKIANKYGLLVIEDGAQGFGGTIEGKKACSFGDISTTSFFPAKPLGCYGDGGAIFTDDKDIKDILESLRVHGKGENKYDNVRIGMNSRLDTIQAAILLVKLKAFQEYELAKRQEIAEWYNKELNEMVDIPDIPKGYTSSYAQYTIQLPDSSRRDKTANYLKERGVPTAIYYKKCLHQQEAYMDMIDVSRNLGKAEKMAGGVLSLPMSAYIENNELQDITVAIKNFVINTYNSK